MILFIQLLNKQTNKHHREKGEDTEREREKGTSNEKCSNKFYFFKTRTWIITSSTNIIKIIAIWTICKLAITAIPFFFLSCLIKIKYNLKINKKAFNHSQMYRQFSLVLAAYANWCVYRVSVLFFFVLVLISNHNCQSLKSILDVFFLSQRTIFRFKITLTTIYSTVLHQRLNLKTNKGRKNETLCIHKLIQ